MTDVFAPQSPSDARDVVRSFNTDGSVNFDQVGFEELDFSAVFGGKTTSTTTNSIAYGIKTFTLDSDDGKIQVGYPIQCQSLDDPDCFMQGVVTRKDTVSVSPAEIDIAITILSPLVNTSNNWELQVVPVAGFSTQPSATVGISTTSIDASGAGPFTFVTQTDKLFMQPNAIGGTVVCASLVNPSIYLFARIVANASTNLVVNKIYSNATGAEAAWSIQLFDGPDAGLPEGEIVGLLVSEATNPDITISSGRVRDTTNTIDLVLTDDITKQLDATFVVGDNQGAQVQSADLSGTISNSGTSVTGVGTTFNSDFSSGAGQVISAGGTNKRVATRTNNTALTTGTSLGSLSGSTYKRGGWSTDGTVHYKIVVARRDSDGVVDVISTQNKTSSSAPDLPSGFTYHQEIADVGVSSGTITSITMSIDSIGAAHLVTYGIPSAVLPNQHTIQSSTSVTLVQPGGSLLEARRAALTGDVTASANSNATTITNNAVTYAKMQDVSAGSKLLGRGDSGTGDAEEITLGTNLSMSGTTLNAAGGGGETTPFELFKMASL